MKPILKKLTTLIITLLLVSFITFLIFDLIPGDPATAMLGTSATKKQLEVMRESMGLNDPFIERYIRWGKGLLGGDMGQSYQYRMPVSDLIGDRIPVTATLAVFSFLLIIFISVPLGILSAKKKNGITDKAITFTTQFFMAVPPFFMGILLTILFGIVLKLFTPGKYISYEEDILGYFSYLLVPAMAIAIPKIAMLVKYLRGSIIEQLGTDYVRTAYSKGYGNNAVLYKHVLKNALIPAITFLGMVVGEIFAGSIIIEQVFAIPGIGRLLIGAIASRDYPVVSVVVVYIAAMVIGVNFLVDILYRKIDPRMHHD